MPFFTVLIALRLKSDFFTLDGIVCIRTPTLSEKIVLYLLYPQFVIRMTTSFPGFLGTRLNSEQQKRF